MVIDGLLLRYDIDAKEISDSARALLFGKLLELVADTVKFYLSDFYHDAQWIGEHVKGSDVEFFFAFRESGTSIGFDQKLVSYLNDATYRVRVYVAENGATRLDVERIG